LVKGYIGPRALVENEVRFLVDPRVGDGTSWITGADAQGRHVVDLVCGRDFTPDGTIEAADVREGDAAPEGHGTLTLARGIQVGGAYPGGFGAAAGGARGRPVRVSLGSHGIGVTGLAAAPSEQYADDKGLGWPPAAAPADVHVVIANTDEPAITGAAGLVEVP